MAFQLAGSVAIQNSVAPRVTDSSNYGVDTRHQIGDFQDLYRIFYMDTDNNIVHKQAISLSDGWADELISAIPYPSPAYAEYEATVDAIWKVGIVALPSNPNDFVWYLPSKDELVAMYTNLHAEGLGDFDTNDPEAGGDWGYYWSSSQFNANTAWRVDFLTGTAAGFDKASPGRIRPVRHFTAPAGTYALGDVGPAGGWIFYVDGTTCYEAAPEDIIQSTSSIPTNWNTSELRQWEWSETDFIDVVGTGTAIGTGLANTNLIIAALVDAAGVEPSSYSIANPYTVSGDYYVTDDGTGGLNIKDSTGTTVGSITSSTDDIDTWAKVIALLPSTYYAELSLGVTKEILQSTLSELLYRATVTNKAITKDPRTLFNDPDWLEAAKLYLDSVAIDQLMIDQRYDAVQVILDRVDVVTNKYSI